MEPERRDLKLGGLLGSPRGSGELHRARVVVGKHLGEILEAFGSLGLDPCRGRDVLGSPGGSWKLGVGDVSGQDVPERVFSLTLHG